MNAVVIARPGGPEVLTVEERPEPPLGEAQVRIRVKAAGVNRADLQQREGKYPPPAGVSVEIPGLEAAGVVDEVGPGARRWKKGDQVCALLAGGGYAESVCVAESHCLPIPQDWDYVGAASLPEAVFTVWHNVFQRGQLTAGERFLVHGGTSGIGLAAIQLATLFGARAVATAGSDEKCQACLDFGAERAINYRREDFEAVLTEEGVNVILDMVGGDYVAKNLRILRPDGRLVFINAMQGAEVEMDVRQVMSKRLTITGSTLRSRDESFKAALAREIEEKVWPLVDAGKFRSTVFRTFPLREAGAAHRLMAASSHIGKLVLET